MTSDLDNLVRETPGLRAAVEALLARTEGRGGRLPRRATLKHIAPEAAAALARIFSPRAVQPAAEGAVRINLEAFLRERGPHAEAELLRALYAVVARSPRDPAGEARASRRELERLLLEIGRTAHGHVAAEMLRTERAALASDDGGRLFAHARERGMAATSRLVLDIVRTLDAVADLEEPVRVQTFAARVLGSSKALRRSGELHRWVAEALVQHDPRTRVLLDEHGVFPSLAAARAKALELNGVLFDEAAASVLCFGPIVYEKRDGRFEHVARHTALGESSRIVLQQLRGATAWAPGARRITIFENLAPYLEYVDACVAVGRTKEEIVLCSGGQANLAVVELLRNFGGSGLPARHAGDLDRSGVLIVRSLVKRTRMHIALCAMDVSTHRRFASRGAPLSGDERGRLSLLVREDDASAPGHDLLNEVLATGVWVEQEAFSDEILGELLAW